MNFLSEAAAELWELELLLHRSDLPLLLTCGGLDGVQFALRCANHVDKHVRSWVFGLFVANFELCRDRWDRLNPTASNPNATKTTNANELEQELASPLCLN